MFSRLLATKESETQMDGKIDWKYKIKTQLPSRWIQAANRRPQRNVWDDKQKREAGNLKHTDTTDSESSRADVVNAINFTRRKTFTIKVYDGPAYMI